MSSPRPASLLAHQRPPTSPAPSSSALPTPGPPPVAKPKKGNAAKDAAKAAKAARRAAAKGGEPGDAPPAHGDDAQQGKRGQQQGGQAQAQAQQQQGKGKGAKGGPQGAGGAAQGHGGNQGGAQGAQGGAAGAGGAGAHRGADAGSNAGGAAAADTLQPFLHLDLPLPSSSLSHSAKSSTANIHPSIIRLALQYSEFKVVGANARCIAMLEAFKDIIASYTPPPQTSLTRHLPTTHLNPQIAHLIRARPLSVSMGTAIRYLKYEISLLDPELDLDAAKAALAEKIDSFIRDRILLASRVIEQHALEKIGDGDVILTYARSSVVEGVLLEAKRMGKDFSVVVVDSRPLYEGKNLLHSLRLASIPTTYVLLPSLSLVLPRVSLCLLGTHALLSNGSMFSRAGTAMVAMMLRGKGVPVVCCCETYKFSERVMLDSIVGNERANPAPLLSDLPPLAAPAPSTSTSSSSKSTPAPPAAAAAPVLPPSLSPLSLLYDVSRPEDVTVVITEAGLIPVQSVPVLLRDYKPVQGRNS
ncbi:translation initiation factor eIF-2B subunit [Rhodotorula paludigena]|uniref:translation initiation factor eIF-2B subunit n=1 Tax=Rhodotorula paludigena TaxID=86838 RepID=UPI00317BB1BF